MTEEENKEEFEFIFGENPGMDERAVGLLVLMCFGAFLIFCGIISFVIHIGVWDWIVNVVK